MTLVCTLFVLASAAIAAPRTLTSIAITGPASVNENSTASYRATAIYSDGSQADVTNSAAWSDNSAFASVTGGVLTAGSVTGDQTVTISASFKSGRWTRTGSLNVTIRDSSPVLSSLTVQGPAAVPESSTARYSAIATFSDGSTADVTGGATWAEDSAYASIASGGVLTTSAVTGNQPFTISASYTSAGVTKSARLAVTIQDSSAATGSHAGKFAVYEGTKTCLTCHTNEAISMHQSVHYQWQGDATESSGLNSTVAGKLGGINDFCIYPNINWLGKLTNTQGKVVDGGCARCHTGLGLKPTPEATQEQLENIDCLFCHAPQYKRTLQLGADNAYHFVADTANMSVSLLEAAQDIRKPTTATCLKCHTNAGGGDNFKRGDIESGHAAASINLDVHLASTAQGGAGLSCLSCHKAAGHRIPGRGVDLRERDTTAKVACTNCHSITPHGKYDLNKHTARVDCTVCHIPAFAKEKPTDMRRDWSAPGDISQVTYLYEPHMTMQSNVTPVYRFFNGKSQFYQFGEPAVPGPNGKILMAGPLGSINEAGSKIYAMKRHEGRQPIDSQNRLLPLKIGVFFQTGDLATAVAQGAAAVGWTYNGYQFAETERYMGLYHEVARKDQALQCSSCHGTSRMDFAALGYTPLATRNGKPLCASCHSARTASFYDIHNKHVGERQMDCSTCHTFSKAN